MFSSYFIALLLSATCVSAIPELQLKVLAAEKVEGVQNFWVTAMLENTGTEPLRVLNDPRGPLSLVPTNTFTITDANGDNPGFTGVKIKYSKRAVVKADRDESFTLLEPGQSVKFVHNLADAYSFTVGGEGYYEIHARNKFHYVNTTTNEILPIYAKKAAPHRLHISGQLAIPRALPNKRWRRSQFQGCSLSQQAVIQEATVAAKEYAAESYQYLQNITKGTDRYTKWWGTFSDDNHAEVTEQYRKLSENDYASMTYDCNTCTETDSFAYVYPDKFGTVYLCASFWGAPVKGSDSKGGTLVHETSHFNTIARTEDTAYGMVDSAKLAAESSKEAIGNADSHEYFSENDPALG